MNAPTLARHLQRRDPPSTSPTGGSTVNIDDLAAVTRLIGRDPDFEIRDHYYRLRRYKSCFYGKALVDYLGTTFQISRGQALRLGQQLEASDYLLHVAGEHPFKDEHLLFRIGPGPQGIQVADPGLDLIYLAELAQAMRGKDGLSYGPRYRRFVRFPNCFRGQEAVTWIARYCDVSRERAVQIGSGMLRANYIQHLYDEHSFQDGNLLYQFI